MKRVIVDYKKLKPEVANLLIDLYPHGYGDDDIIILRKPGGEIVETVEVKTEDTLYLVKISKSLSRFISDFDAVIEKELGTEDENMADLEMEKESDNLED